jgi:hypothetical protein
MYTPEALRCQAREQPAYRGSQEQVRGGKSPPNPAAPDCALTYRPEVVSRHVVRYFTAEHTSLYHRLMVVDSRVNTC